MWDCHEASKLLGTSDTSKPPFDLSQRKSFKVLEQTVIERTALALKFPHNSQVPDRETATGQSDAWKEDGRSFLTLLEPSRHVFGHLCC